MEKLRKLEGRGKLSAARKYLNFTGRYVTWKKILNVCLIEFEKFLKRPCVRGKPYVLVLESTNLCNLRCPGCLTGIGKNPVPEGQMTFGEFKSIIDDVGDYLILAKLDGVGEPLINKDIYKMISYAHGRGVGTTFSTNFLLFSEEDAERLIKAGLDHLTIAVDGVTQATYAKYRVGGELAKVLNNVKVLLRKREELGVSHPIVELQFIIFDHNEHELPQIEELALELGVDRLYITESIARRLRARKPNLGKTKACYWLWNVISINWNGDYKSCSRGFISRFSLGNTRYQSPKEVWNNQSYRMLRALSARGEHPCANAIERIAPEYCCEQANSYFQQANSDPGPVNGASNGCDSD